MNDKEIQQIQANVKATLAIEGCTVSDDAQQINKLFLAGLITSDEAIHLIKQKYLNIDKNSVLHN